MSAQFRLLEERRFLPFFMTQFLGAFNDNFFKNALVVLMTFQATRFTSMSPGILVNLAAGLFILPFFLFSATAGQIADKFEKSRLIRFTKLLEIVIMLLGCLAFALMSLPLMLATLFLMGTQSAIFGPVKYAILPQQLREDELIGGNALVEAGTFVSILLGTIVGGLLVAVPAGPTWVSIGVVLVAVAGYLASRQIPVAAAADPALVIDWNPITETWRNIQFTRRNRTVFLSILGVSWFWFYGALFLSQFPGFAADVLGGDEKSVTLLLAMFSVGIGVGSLACEKLSQGKIEIGLVPFGAIGLSLFAFDLWWASPAVGSMGSAQSIGVVFSHPSTWRIVFDLVMIGMFGGFFIVPLYALIQTRSEPQYRSRVIAGNNILNALFMVVAAGLAAGMLAAGFSIAQLILMTAVLNAVVAIYIFTLVPEFLLRFVAWMLVHTVYRLQVRGAEHIPERGAAVLVANHVSYVDALIIMAACRRPVRFLMDHKVFRWPLMSFVFRASGAIPIASISDDAALNERAFEEASRALAAGEVIAIFPEGRMTESGQMTAFRSGVSRIVAGKPVPVVPMALSGMWGSTFSRKGGAGLMSQLWHGLFKRIELNIGTPMAAQATSPDALQAAVALLMEKSK